MRIALLTDAWKPQVNGEVTALTALVRELEAAGHDVLVIHPGLFVTVPCPTYTEIRLAAAPLPGVARRLQRFVPDAVHIATEGSVGLAGWLYCRLRGWRFTTSFHTRFPEYVSARFPIPTAWGYGFVRWFHKYSGKVMVATPSMRKELEAHNFHNVVSWTRGVDIDLRRPGGVDPVG